MSEWDKLKAGLIEFIKSCDDTPTEEQNRIYDILVGGLIAEGDKNQQKLDAVKNLLEDNRDWLVLDLDGKWIVEKLDEGLKDE